MSGLIDRLLGVPAGVVLVVVGLLVLAEDALFVGFVLPGETAAILGGVAVRLGHVPLAGVLVVVIAAAIVGDSIGDEIERHFGPRILELPVLQQRRSQLDCAQEFLARRGGPAVFLARWVAFLRAAMPALAGTGKMRYPTFLAFNAAGGIAWGTAVVLTGYLSGKSYARVEKSLGRGAALVVAAILVIALAVWRAWRRHLEARSDVEVSQEQTPCR